MLFREPHLYSSWNSKLNYRGLYVTAPSVRRLATLHVARTQHHTVYANHPSLRPTIMATDASANTKTSVTPTGDLIPDVGQASQISGTAGSSSQSLAATPSSRTKVISNDHTGTRGFNSVNRPSSGAHETSLANQVANEDEDTLSQNAYSTRSRGKNSTRPNYAEDGEVELDAKVGMSHKYSSKASSSLQGTSKHSQATSHDVSKGDLEEATSTDGNHSGNVSSSEASFPRTTVEHSSERKKRKYIKTSTGKPGLSHVLPSLKTSIPGTSHFSAVASATPDVTTSKRRKLGHDPRRSSAEIPPVVSAKRRVSSMSQLKGRGVPMPSSLVTFEKCGAILQGGGLVADDGQVYAVNGQSLMMRSVERHRERSLITTLQTRYTLSASPQAIRTTCVGSWSFVVQTQRTQTRRSSLCWLIGFIAQKILVAITAILAIFLHQCSPTNHPSLRCAENAAFSIVQRSAISKSTASCETHSGSTNCTIDTFTDPMR